MVQRKTTALGTVLSPHRNPGMAQNTFAHLDAAQPDNKAIDLDPQKRNGVTSVVDKEGAERAHFLIEGMIAGPRTGNRPYSATTEYINTIPVDQQPKYPGDPDMEIKIHNYIRWNAMAMVVRANKTPTSAATSPPSPRPRRSTTSASRTFWRAPSEQHGGDLIFFQGHSVPGVYARAFMLGPPDRRADGQLPPGSRRQGHLVLPAPLADAGLLAVPDRVDGPRPAVAIYQARFMKYMDSRGLIAPPATARSGPSSATARPTRSSRSAPSAWPAREKLDNLVFVINCNLQRLDGPVRGNGKIIQELEGDFRGAGWNVIKLIWGTHWDALFARDKKGILKAHDGTRRRRVPDLQGQGRRLRARALLQHARAAALVADWTDDDIWR
jgi:pyruvate dehydrogenase E1 component